MEEQTTYWDAAHQNSATVQPVDGSWSDYGLVLKEDFKALGVQVWPVHEAVGEALDAESCESASRQGIDSEERWMQAFNEASGTAKKTEDLILYVQLIDHSCYGLQVTNSPERLDQWDGSVGAVLLCSRKGWEEAFGNKRSFNEENVMNAVQEDVAFLEHYMNGWLWEVVYDIDGDCYSSGPFLDEESARKSLIEDGHPEICFDADDFEEHVEYSLTSFEIELMRDAEARKHASPVGLPDSADGEWCLRVKSSSGEERCVIGCFETEAQARDHAEKLFKNANIHTASNSRSFHL